MIPAVGNTHELQNQKFQAGKWFMEMAQKANPRDLKSVTAQGFYVAGADGKGYAFNNNRDPQRVLGFIQKGLAGFRKDPPAKVDIAEDEVNAQYSRGPDPSVSVLQVYSRIKPLPESCDELNHNIGRDFLWIYPEEVKTMRESVVAPASLVKRLLRFHFVDNIRGEPDMWDTKDIQSSSFVLKRLSTDRFALTGRFAMKHGDRGIEGAFESEITFDPKEDRVKAFKGFAKTLAWGAGTYTPKPPAGRFPILYAIVPATADYAKLTPPAAALYGDWDYRKPR